MLHAGAMTSLRLEYDATPQVATAIPQTGGLPATSEGWRRALNVLVALIGLIVLAPVALIIALAVKLTSRGPILYTQTRVGLDRRGGSAPPEGIRRTLDLGGRPFRIFKFRTMYVDARREPDQVWATARDPRVTPVGRVLRKLRLDELPQLWNVLVGDMNIVGPRPEQPKIFVDLRHQIQRYEARQRVRPGITGWAQINQSYDSCLDDVKRKVAFDLEYIARQSLLEDLKIMLLTVPVIVFRKGAW